MADELPPPIRLMNFVSEDQSKREYERQVADEEEQELLSFQAALASQSNVVHELKETRSVPKIQDKTAIVGRKNPPSRPLGMLIKVKKAKVGNAADSKETPKIGIVSKTMANIEASRSVANTALVSYSDESEDDDDDDD